MGTNGSRLKRVGWGPGEDRIRTSPATWANPLQWQRIARAAGVVLDVFCLSLGDWADNEVDDRWRLDLADIILRTPNLRWLLLTKRIPNAERYLRAMFPHGVPPNVCLGITVVTQAEVDRDLPRAVAVKKALGIKRLFLSMEPLLESVVLPAALMVFLDLVIAGGESGRDARAMNPAWVVDLMEQCARANVAFHFKQWGEWQPLLNGVRVSKVYIHGQAYEGAALHHFPNDKPAVRTGSRKSGRMLRGREYLERIPA